jgi:hypothetical protein
VPAELPPLDAFVALVVEPPGLPVDDELLELLELLPHPAATAAIRIATAARAISRTR